MALRQTRIIQQQTHPIRMRQHQLTMMISKWHQMVPCQTPILESVIQKVVEEY